MFILFKLILLSNLTFFSIVSTVSVLVVLDSNVLRRSFNKFKILLILIASSVLIDSLFKEVFEAIFELLFKLIFELVLILLILLILF